LSDAEEALISRAMTAALSEGFTDESFLNSVIDFASNEHILDCDELFHCMRELSNMH
jgi:hypothetical protein